MNYRRRSLRAIGILLAAGLLATACSGGGSPTALTVTDNVTVGRATSGQDGTTFQYGSTSSGASSQPTSTQQIGATGVSNSGSGITTSALPPGALPDGFVPTRMKPGEKPPQFIIVSFDGVGWHEKWQYWMGIARRVPFHFTGFLSGTYVLSDQTKTHYAGPGHAPGHSAINWNTAAELPVEISDLNAALASGDEIGTHFNGHFCTSAGSVPGGNDWDTSDWNNELDQFFGLVKNVDVNNGLPGATKLNLPAGEVKGERTPCLEGHKADLFPALVAHGMTYDSSFTRRGISWPTKDPATGIWQTGMAEYPMHGTRHYQITMDYNFYYDQENASSAGVPPAKSATDSAQVKATYEDMYNQTFNGNRAPLILGNHFNAWNNNAYSDAIGNFVLETCGKPDTYCVPFRDLFAWIAKQDPARIAQLQAESPELGLG